MRGKGGCKTPRIVPVCCVEFYSQLAAAVRTCGRAVPGGGAYLSVRRARRSEVRDAFWWWWMVDVETESRMLPTDPSWAGRSACNLSDFRACNLSDYRAPLGQLSRRGDWVASPQHGSGAAARDARHRPLPPAPGRRARLNITTLAASQAVRATGLIKAGPERSDMGARSDIRVEIPIRENEIPSSGIIWKSP